MAGHAPAIAAHFGKASQSYESAARLQRHSGYAALKLLESVPRNQLLDLGCGPAWLHPELASQCQTLLAADLSAGMLQQARQLGLASQYLQADAAALPLPARSLDAVFSNLMLQWCPRPAEVAAELQRLLRPGGQAVITSLLHGTLAELRQAFLAAGLPVHVNAFLSADVLLSAMQQGAPAMQWQLRTESVQLPYPDVLALARELKSLGANYVLAADAESGRGLTGRRYWQQLQQAYPCPETANRAAPNGIVASYQLAYLVGVKA